MEVIIATDYNHYNSPAMKRRFLYNPIGKGIYIVWKACIAILSCRLFCLSVCLSGECVTKRQIAKYFFMGVFFWGGEVWGAAPPSKAQLLHDQDSKTEL